MKRQTALLSTLLAGTLLVAALPAPAGIINVYRNADGQLVGEIDGTGDPHPVAQAPRAVAGTASQPAPVIEPVVDQVAESVAEPVDNSTLDTKPTATRGVLTESERTQWLQAAQSRLAPRQEHRVADRLAAQQIRWQKPRPFAVLPVKSDESTPKAQN